MKKLLLASVLAIASFPGYAAEEPDTPAIREEWKAQCAKGDQDACRDLCHEPEDNCDDKGNPPDLPKPPVRVTVAPPYQGPPPIGWVYAPYIQCPDKPGLYGLLGLYCPLVVVTVPAAGLNVRTVPNGPPTIALVNGTPLYPVRQEGPWLLVAPACDLTPTWAWSWTTGEGRGHAKAWRCCDTSEVTATDGATITPPVPHWDAVVAISAGRAQL